MKNPLKMINLHDKSTERDTSFIKNDTVVYLIAIEMDLEIIPFQIRQKDMLNIIATVISTCETCRRQLLKLLQANVPI